ncbi:hypothetical protein Q4555_14660 [Octadecabacter sp. 1_MG-2023]|uniref:hypothetical protein n=1 Tax=unclassified Octadecabacter TaxID=196158 RepID=UPI001C08ADC7|nr:MULTISPECIES: hypothetical protein [unclassified Octadecabacter]MBU2991943.1 hypothetical protein [Octadecabacter sp. B2R22]MDO6735917.1 hypothetical protein [Octadecabacter sp. 1_MG-2023]
MSNDILITTLIDDTVRYIHLLSVAIGIGASFFADFNVLRRIRSTVNQPLLDTLDCCHRIVWAAIVVMWASGLALIYLRTGFVLENFSPKLFTKILVVTVLTANALVIGLYAVPCLEQRLGKRILNMPNSLRLPMACIAGVSTLSWLFALALGSSRFLAKGSAELFYTLVPFAYGSCIAVALLSAIAIGTSQRKPSLD